eukprot:tig00001206_g7500.t1
MESNLDLLYEEAIIRNPLSYKQWVAYVETKRNAHPRERNTLFERGLKKIPMSYKFWRYYLKDRKDQIKALPISHPAYETVNNVYERCLVFMHKMPRIWMEYLQFLMDQKRITKTRRTFDRALRALPITQHDKIWPMYIKFARTCGCPDTAIRIYRRYIKLEPEQIEEFIEHLLSVERYDEAAKHLTECVNDDRFISSKGKTKHMMWSELCELLAKHPDKIKSVKADLIIRSGAMRFTDEVGKMWSSLADYYIQLGHFDKARDVYEEAITTVTTVRDFSILFDAYSQFEESLIAAKMEGPASEPGQEDDMDLHLARLEYLMERRPLLLSSVLLRQNPHNVHEWLKRARIFKADPVKTIQIYSEACKTVDPQKATGKPQALWITFAKFYEEHEDLDNARLVFEKATEVKFKGIDELASIWCEYAEFELRHKNFSKALELCRRATMPPFRKRLARGAPDEKPLELTVQERVYRSTRLWSFYVDLEESLGSFTSTRAVYDKILELRIATPQIIINYAHFLEEHKYFEDSFKVYEQGIALFPFPHALDIWITYINKFIARYGGKKLERARDLFEQAIEKCPVDKAKVLYLMYAKLEEDYGLARHAMAVYDRACNALAAEAKYEMYLTYIARAADLFGVAKTREIYEQAIEKLPEKHIKDMCLRYADLERKLGEVDRARGIYIHCAQYCDPRTEEAFWKVWHDFEVAHGNEDTFRDMLRIKRSVQATYTQVSFTSMEMLAATRAHDEENIAKRRKIDEGGDGDLAKLERSILGDKPTETPRLGAAPGRPAPQQREAEEVEREPMDVDGTGEDADDDNDEDGPAVRVEQKAVPKAVFGDLAALAEKQGTDAPLGALARLRGAKRD